MKDLGFAVAVEWLSNGGERRGSVDTGGQTVAWSVPASMGGLGEGTSPEELLLAAVGTCYSATLAGALRRRRLPVGRVRLAVHGTVASYPEQTRFARVVVHPTLAGADPERSSEYQEAAREARDRCFIGHSLRPDIAYDVGAVAIEA